MFGERWKIRDYFVIIFERFVGDGWKTPEGLGGAPRVIKGHFWKDSGIFEHVFNIFGSSQDPPKSHVGDFLNIFEYLEKGMT